MLALSTVCGPCAAGAALTSDEAAELTDDAEQGEVGELLVPVRTAENALLLVRDFGLLVPVLQALSAAVDAAATASAGGANPTTTGLFAADCDRLCEIATRLLVACPDPSFAVVATETEVRGHLFSRLVSRAGQLLREDASAVWPLAAALAWAQAVLPLALLDADRAAVGGSQPLKATGDPNPVLPPTHPFFAARELPPALLERQALLERYRHRCFAESVPAEGPISERQEYRRHALAAIPVALTVKMLFLQAECASDPRTAALAAELALWLVRQQRAVLPLQHEALMEEQRGNGAEGTLMPLLVRLALAASPVEALGVDGDLAPQPLTGASRAAAIAVLRLLRKVAKGGPEAFLRATKSSAGAADALNLVLASACAASDAELEQRALRVVQILFAFLPSSWSSRNQHLIGDIYRKAPVPRRLEAEWLTGGVWSAAQPDNPEEWDSDEDDRRRHGWLWDSSSDSESESDSEQS